MIDENHATSSKIPKWKYEEIEKKVLSLYTELNIRKLPIDPLAITRKLGYILVPFSKVGEAVEPQSENDENDAFSFFNPKYNKFVIVYDNKKPLARLRFTLMHEIGHIQLGHKHESDLARRMADYYAGYALAPTPLIHKFARNGIEAIRTVFSVSKYCAEICHNRYSNWLLYGDFELKNYEKTFLDLFD